MHKNIQFGACILGYNYADQYLLKTWSVLLEVLELMLDYNEKDCHVWWGLFPMNLIGCIS